MLSNYAGAKALVPIFDANWRGRAVEGDAAAIQSLVDAALEPLYAFCLYRVGRDQHLCEEVVQETLLRALRDLGNYDPQRSNNHIFSWLTGLARFGTDRRRATAARGDARSGQCDHGPAAAALPGGVGGQVCWREKCARPGVQMGRVGEGGRIAADAGPEGVQGDVFGAGGEFGLWVAAELIHLPGKPAGVWAMG
jgi:hypothetical protein